MADRLARCPFADLDGGGGLGTQVTLIGALRHLTIQVTLVPKHEFNNSVTRRNLATRKNLEYLRPSGDEPSEIWTCNRVLFR